ncbi:Grx4 family monothiol glutaredoxin [Tumidithrix elongata RA019]|uniref:Glutaredoxin n=1 Tax=Tumidithrix elongata BACA0141 TaxID=2716417 RepID=A0AAW9Q365_9CYAN|nr:Grx4 family monothiol glutaredoxin [Tumidithrix elongata RA019]
MNPIIQTKIEGQINNNKIMIYMKGTPSMPQCGFSAATIQVFSALGYPFETYDILQDPEIRQGIKEFSNWPTIPQVYVNGEFVGGCDIVMEMHKQGELEPLLKEAMAS